MACRSSLSPRACPLTFLPPEASRSVACPLSFPRLPRTFSGAGTPLAQASSSEEARGEPAATHSPSRLVMAGEAISFATCVGS